ncbi:PspC domain-containing protein [Saccharopolyspora sp. TS4A08]|uniref:PspC domain-containing protein n=2 Tax=Saccharopolyspora ipomoeae TaxID=3042027 RepID=A0ABT6PM78_9PSEU|nr:ATP-binding protein [Saccharopolyspora sp. TS4A08]MDI2028935.1 PspC domain-containing protein [Saccharopolyspora sp. TS4A08]
MTAPDDQNPSQPPQHAPRKVNPMRTDPRMRRGGEPTERMLPVLPQLHRTRDGRLLAGVCAGVAEHLGVRVLWVRMTFAVLSALGGAGILGYALLWAFVPQGGGSRPATKREWQQGFGIVLLGVGALAAFGAVLSMPTWLTVPLVVALVGAAVVWREADDSQRRRWRQGARSGVAGALLGSGARSAWIRVMSGAALVVVGMALLVGSTTSLDALPTGLLASGATLVGVAVLTVPWWVRMMRDLNVERSSRIRSQERAEIAAHLHDSVLQTLALIQKQAGSEREVRRLARGQERELRGWLYGPDGYGAAGDSAGTSEEAEKATFAAEVARICGEVEDHFAITVQQVVVGDCEVDDRLTAQLNAAREALVNAAKHAGVREVSVYAEVEPELVSVFVRDRGAGFDPDQVPEDRHGLADSVRGRVQRHGGKVKVRTSPGQGTEVAMEMPRSAA